MNKLYISINEDNEILGTYTFKAPETILLEENSENYKTFLEYSNDYHMFYIDGKVIKGGSIFDLDLLTNEEELNSLHQYLIDTDYIVIKIYEAQILNNEELVNSLKQKYSEELTKRIEVRNRINELEEIK